MWRDYLCKKLELKENYTKIISDKFGFSKDDEFKSFLENENIEYRFADNIEDLLRFTDKYANIFVPNSLDVPQFIKNKYICINADENLFPFEIAGDVIVSVKEEELKKIIIFCLNNPEYAYIDKNNFNKILEKAQNYYLKMRNKYLINKINVRLDNISNYDDLLSIAGLYGEVVYNMYILNEDIEKDFIDFMDSVVVDKILKTNIYRNAFYAPLSDFKTVNRAVSYIDSKNIDKFAFVCFDGMGIPEWKILKNFLNELHININEKYIFSLIPTTTAISRSSLFSGKLEECYKTKINEFLDFKNNFSRLYTKSFSEGEISKKDDLLGVDVVKITYNIFDDSAHGSVVARNKRNKNNYLRTVENYLKNSSILNELKILVNSGYKIFISSDHGCIVTVGNGIKIEKYLIESSSKRAAIVRDSALLKQYKERLILYEPPFSDKTQVLIPKNRHSFFYKDKLTITHGGITLEEMVVPFVELDL